MASLVVTVVVARAHIHKRVCVLSKTLCRNLLNFVCRTFVFRPKLSFGAEGDANASAKEVSGRGTLSVLVLGGGELGGLTRLGATDLAARGGFALRSGRVEGVLTVGDDPVRVFF